MHTTMSRLTAVLGLAATVIGAGCNNFDIKDPNAPSLSSITNNPTRAALSAFATGMLFESRVDIQSFIWRVGSMGREGINLSGNNQPDYGEPYFGPLNPSEFGGALWAAPYAEIRNANIYIDAVPKSPDLSATEKAAALGFAQTLKALAFLYIVETRAQLGAPVDVDRPPTAAPAPWASEDNVYATIIATLDSARANLAGAGSSFPFPMPPGYTQFGFGNPQQFRTFAWALEAKANVFRATDNTHCGGTASSCYAAAETALDSSFLTRSAANFAVGPYFDFSNNPGDDANLLSEPLNGPIYFALIENLLDAQRNGADTDARAVAKIMPVQGTAQSLGGIPILGTLKFSNLFVGGLPSPAAPIPIIRDEELVLLYAEAEIGLGQLGAAENDLNLVRSSAGLAPLASTDSLLPELLYNRRYSLLWEQGTRWIDARRYNRLATIPAEPQAPSPWPAPGHVPPVMPIPQDECEARNLGPTCTPLGP
jgi:hypothetical protein